SSADEVMAESGGDASQVPVQLSDNAFIRPFRSLVTSFAMPNYRELDPSFFVGITFLIMFGYMFGDVGQGAVLAGAGLFLRLRRSLPQNLRDYGFMLIGCGISAMIFGVLYGSVFGYEELIPHLWVSPSPLHSGIPQLLATSVGIGVIFLSVSLIINIINHYRVKQYLEGSLDKCGLVGLIFYWACLGAAAQVVLTGSISGWTALFIVIPLVLIFLGHPIINLVKHRSIAAHGDSVSNVIINSMIEILETFTGYLSGTFSFVRVGAYAISHAALCLAVYSIMNMLSDVPGGIVLQILVAVIGNIFVIGFEGMVAAIQCVRLEYYELFSRFFRGGGIAYKPFKIRK
ncbi:MAG: hypothetical protein J6S21_00040, partial [Victivallales bacterium]|nr:hypothetical protein [Victivallales bacterium]